MKNATSINVSGLFSTFQRVRKLKAIEQKFENVTLKFAKRAPKSPDEWALVVEVRKGDKYTITAVAMGTIDKATAVRRAYGWGLLDKDGVIWPPEDEKEEEGAKG